MLWKPTETIFTLCFLLFTKYSISDIVRRIKSISIYRVWKLHEDFLSTYSCKEPTFFSDGYFVSPVFKRLLAIFSQPQNTYSFNLWLSLSI
ncbi:MAG: transposase [Solitalea-like symbiont of Acarus siro]